jgi:hypothetical protein
MRYAVQGIVCSLVAGFRPAGEKPAMKIDGSYRSAID